jgi:hypothetical protein
MIRREWLPAESLYFLTRNLQFASWLDPQNWLRDNFPTLGKYLNHGHRATYEAPTKL